MQFNPRFWKSRKSLPQEDAAPSGPTQQRGIDVPEKVYIGKEGKEWEYSLQEPATIGAILDGLVEGFYSNQNFIELFYSVPEVFAPVHEIASRVADATWQLRKDWNDEVDYKDAQFNRLFTQPNPLLSFKDFVYQAVCYEILTGKQFFFFNQSDILGNDYQSIITWSNLPAHTVTAELRKGIDPFTATELKDFVTGYRIPLNGVTRHFPPERVLPICHLSLTRSWDLNDCKSQLLGAKMPIKNLIPVYLARGTVYIKRGAMGFVVSRKADEGGSVAMTPKEKENVRKDFQDTYGLTGNKATVGITGEPVDFIKTSMSIAEMQPFDETLADAVAIYRVLRVPRHLVPSKDNSTFANAAADMKAFYTDVIIPWAKRYAEAWTNHMKLKDSRRYIFPDYSHIDVLQENRKEKAEADKTNIENANTLYKEGVVTKNERNAILGYASVVDGNVYAGQADNSDPLAVQIGVGGVQALQGILSDANIGPEAKKHALVILFGISEEDAGKMVIKPKTEKADATPGEKQPFNPNPLKTDPDNEAAS